MVKDFRLELNTPTSGVYIFPCEVTGNVVVVTDEAKSYDAIRVTLRGYADASWTENETETDSNGESRTVSRSYHSHEDYINHVIVLWNQEQVPNGVLNPGHYIFPFRFEVLPGRLPSSFEGNVGHIRYEVEGRISTRLFHFDKTVLGIIQVVDRVDINVPALMSPVEYEDEKTICCLCCASPPIILTVNVPRTGFCIGEGIPLTARLDNGSGRIINLLVTVTKTVTFYAQGSTNGNREILNEIQSPPIQPRSTNFRWTLSTEELAIRSTIPTIANSEIVRLQYNLRVKALIPWAINAAIDIPFTLGNIPPQSTAGQPPILYPSPQ